jgi:hypothetical protein
MRILANKKSGAVHHEFTTATCAVGTMASKNRLDGDKLPFKIRGWIVRWFPCRACWSENGYTYQRATEIVQSMVNYDWELR